MLQEKRTAVLMLCATILRDRTTVHANRDTMEMEISAVRVTFLLLYFLSQFLYCFFLFRLFRLFPVIRRSSIITMYIEI